ncbi:hypothetical protein EON65_09300 [archaeon]|nr:MAG: hypothetical protein EON65_09300 [archaeon]
MLHIDSSDNVSSSIHRDPKGKETERADNHSHTASNRRLNDQSFISQSFEQWKSTQLMTYVVIQQLNKQKIRNLYDTRNTMYSYFSTQELNKIDDLNEKKHPEMVLDIHKCLLHFMDSYSPFNDSVYYVQFFLGPLTFKSNNISPLMPHSIEFTVPALPSMNINDIQLCDLLMEVVNLNNTSLEKVLIGRASVSLDNTVGRNFNQVMAYHLDVYDNDHRHIGHMELQLRAKLSASYIRIYNKEDVYDMQQLEELTVEKPKTKELTLTHGTHQEKSRQKSIAMLTSRNLSVHLPDSHLFNNDAILAASTRTARSGNELSGADMWLKGIGELRGDGTETLLDNTPYVDIQSDLDSQSVTYGQADVATNSKLPQSSIPLPNFNNAKIFLEKKLSLHTMSVQLLARSIDERKIVLEELIKQKQDVLTKYQNDNKTNIKKFTTQAEDIKGNISVMLKAIQELRKPHPEPKEPDFEDLGPVPFVPNITLPSQLDAKGKKKKALAAEELKNLLDSMELGKYDGHDNIPISDNAYPNQAQLMKINKAREARNVVLENKRTQELNNRERLREMYRTEYERFVELERIRNNNLKKACKDARKQHLKYYNLTTRVQRFEEENKAYDEDKVSISNLVVLHQKASQNYKQMVLNFMLEFQRLENFVSCNKKKLHKLLNARRHILEYPSTARTKAEYDIYAKQCAEYLYSIQLEIYSIKHLMYMEGKKLQHLLTEERGFYEQELMRLNVSIEIINQRFAFDSMTTLYRVNTADYYNTLLKLQIIEAEEDDEGTDTIEDKGECYKSDKEWQSNGVNKYLNLIKTLEKKIDTINKYNLSTATSQTIIISHFMNVVNQSIYNHQDSYMSVSDYERATLLYQVVANAMNHPSRLASFIQKQHQLTNEKTHLSSKLSIILKSYQQNIVIHEQETHHMNENAHVILASSRDYIEEYRNKTEARMGELEQNIVVLSKECQKIREELLSQQMVYADKIKILWAFIHTLQQSLQQLTSKMEIMSEENEKVVIKSKLMADHMKLALHKERQHNANLYFILHSQRGIVKYLYEVIQKIIRKNAVLTNMNKVEKSKLRQEIYNTVYMYIIMSTNLDYLFEFFLSRIASLAGSNVKINNQLAEYKIADILTACCRIENHQIKYYAAKALSNLGWNSYVEKRILIWDALNYWKHLKKRIIDKLYTEAKQAQSNKAKEGSKVGKEDKQPVASEDDLLDDDDELNNLNIYQEGFTLYDQNSNISSIVRLYNQNNPNNQILMSNGNVSLRTLIKQRKQWALRVTKRKESPNTRNQKLLNGVIMTLFQLCIAENQELSFSMHDLNKLLQQVQHEVSSRTLYHHDDQIEKMVEIIQTLHDRLTSQSPRGTQALQAVQLSPTSQNNFAINITRYAALAIAIASYEQSNHHDILSQPLCIYGIYLMCQAKDIEIQSHAAISIANLCYRNELAQMLFGELGLITQLTTMLTYDIADILEASTSALANLTSYNDKNCRYFIENDGVAVSVKVLVNPNTENLLDSDQSDEVQANISELLTNVSRYNTDATISYFTEDIIQSLILLCACNNIQCKRYVPLILGNISQNNVVRGHIGMLGGIEALFLALESDDPVVKCNILWSLSNMMYYPPNQERGGRYISELLPYILISNINIYTENIRNFAMILLGNLLYYNTANRVRFLEIDFALETVITYIKEAVNVYSANANAASAPSYINMVLIESALRILLSLSYLDSIALYLGANDTNIIPVLIHYLSLPYLSHAAIRYTLEILSNLSLHHNNRLSIYNNNGIEHVIPLHAHMDEEIRRLSVQMISYLEDITPEEVLVRKKNEIDIERMVKLSTHEDVLVRALAAEQMGEYVYNHSTNSAAAAKRETGGLTGSPTKGTMTSMSATGGSNVSAVQDHVASIGGIDSLLAILNNPHEPILALLPALWSLRNVVQGNVDSQNQIHYRDGISVLCNILTHIYARNIYAEQVDKVIESILSCLLVCIHKHDRNSRRLVMIGLDRLLPLSTTSHIQLFASKNRANKKDLGASQLPPIGAGATTYTVTDPFVMTAMQADHIQSLLHQLLLLLGPYNYVVCQNCGKKQDLHGTSCLYCAHRLLVPLNETNPKFEHNHIHNSPKKAAAQKVLLSKSTSNLPDVDPTAQQQAYEHKPHSANDSPMESGTPGQGASSMSKFSMSRSLPAKKPMFSQDT